MPKPEKSLKTLEKEQKQLESKIKNIIEKSKINFIFMI